MRRWNGWGDESTTYPLPSAAERYLQERIGQGSRQPNAPLEGLLQVVPASRLPVHPAINTDPLERLLHARGQSLPDWIALRSGRIKTFPDGVAYPETDEQVRELLSFAQKQMVRVIPFGGGTSVVGHINPLPDFGPVLTIDLSRMNRLTGFDETSRLATIGAGAAGPWLEAQLQEHGYTLGHFPQSFELSTLGGWIATRSSGQQSYYYGRIEDVFAGGHVETLAGPLDLQPFPASAAGPDLRQVILGSEGRLGIITRAIVKVRPKPAFEAFYGAFFPDWESGILAVRELAQERAALSMARLSDAQETETTLALSGKGNLVAWAGRGMSLIGYGQERCLLVFGITGETGSARGVYRRTAKIIRRHGGLLAGQVIGKIWQKSRFRTPYLRNTLWEHGYALDTLETAVPWTEVQTSAHDIVENVQQALAEDNEPGMVFAHLSHIYETGASIYITYLFRRSQDPLETLAHWKKMKRSASEAILAHGGTISHQHGVGLDHAPYIGVEKGEVGIEMLGDLIKSTDPYELLNPGKLLPEGKRRERE